jgi:hypothetical protein
LFAYLIGIIVRPGSIDQPCLPRKPAEHAGCVPVVVSATPCGARYVPVLLKPAAGGVALFPPAKIVVDDQPNPSNPVYD